MTAADIAAESPGILFAALNLFGQEPHDVSILFFLCLENIYFIFKNFLLYTLFLLEHTKKFQYILKYIS